MGFDDDQSIQSNTDNRGLTWEVSERTLRVPKNSMYDIFEIRFFKSETFCDLLGQ